MSSLLKVSFGNQTDEAVKEILSDNAKLEAKFASIFKGAVHGIFGEKKQGEKDGFGPLAKRLVKSIFDEGSVSVRLVLYKAILKNVGDYEVEKDENAPKALLKKLEAAEKREHEEKKEIDASDSKSASSSTPVDDNDSEPSLAEVVKEVQEILLDRHHLILAGFNINPHSTSASQNRVSPIASVSNTLAKLQKKHGLDNTPLQSLQEASEKGASSIENKESSDKKNNEAIKKTNEAVDAFCEKATRACTLYTIDYLFGSKRGDVEYGALLKEDSEKTRTEFSKKQKGWFRRKLAHPAYWLMNRVFKAVIEKTFKKIISDLRYFLKEGVNDTTFVNDQILKLAEYFGRIEKGRTGFLQPNRPDQAGSFDKFLEQTINLYANKYTEDELFKILEDYLVENYVERPNFSMKKVRIPFITWGAEKISHVIEISLVRRYFRKSGVLKSMMDKSKKEKKQTLVGLKKLVTAKLNKATKSIQKQRNLKQETAKTQKVSQEHLLSIQQFSVNLVRFIAIAECNGDKYELKKLDAQWWDPSISNMTSATRKLICGLIPFLKNTITPFESTLNKKCIQTYKDACTNMVTLALGQIFEDSEAYIEEQLQNVIGIFEQNFAATPTKERLDADEIEADNGFKLALQTLSRLAVEDAVKEEVQQLGKGKHERVKNFAKREKETFEKVAQELNSAHQKLTDATNVEARTQALTRFCAVTDYFTRHLSTTLVSKEFEDAYTDVQGDLKNLVYEMVETHVTEGFLPALQEIAESNAALAEATKLQTEMTKVEDALGEDSVNTDTIQGALQNSTWDQKEVFLQQIETLNKNQTILKALTENAMLIQNIAQKEAEKNELTSELAQLQKDEDDLNNVLINKDNDAYGRVQNKYGLPDLNEEKALHRILRPSFWRRLFSRKKTPFQTIAQKRKEKNIALVAHVAELAAEEAKLPSNIKEKTEDGVKGEIRTLKQQLQALVTTCKTAQTEIINTQTEAITESVAKIPEHLEKMEEEAKKLHVRGFYAIGKARTIDVAQDTLVSQLTPIVRKKIQALVTEFSKPFHTNQMIIRTILLHIAETHESGA